MAAFWVSMLVFGCSQNACLGGGFKYFLFSPLFGEMIQFDEHIFQMGWFNHQPVVYFFNPQGSEMIRQEETTDTLAEANPGSNQPPFEPLMVQKSHSQPPGDGAKTRRK